jgi:tetratricopeptide (TPR) repeat protein
MNLKQLKTLITSLSVVSCSSQTFYKKIDSSNLDLLSEESMMRFDTKRIDQTDSSSKDTIQKAILACHANKFIKGMGLLEDQMQQNKSNPFYWNALGSCYFLSKEYSKALFFYNVGLEAISAQKNSDQNLAQASILNNIGLIHLQFKRYNEAYDMFSRSLSLSQSLVTPQFNLAQLYVEFNLDDKALAILKPLETKKPNDIDLLYLKSVIFFKKKDYSNSLKELREIKKDYLNRADIVGLYAYNLILDKKLEEAKNIIEKRTYADEFNERNKLVAEKINEDIKEQKAKK